MKTPQVESVDTGAPDEFSTPTMAAPAARFADMKTERGATPTPPTVAEFSTTTMGGVPPRSTDKEKHARTEDFSTARRG